MVRSSKISTVHMRFSILCTYVSLLKRNGSIVKNQPVHIRFPIKAQWLDRQKLALCTSVSLLKHNGYIVKTDAQWLQCQKSAMCC